MKEIWKDVDGYNGFYKVSSFGRVMSLKRTIIGRSGRLYHVENKILKPNKARKYLGVLFSNRCDKKFVNVHRLVAIAFIKNPKNKHQVNHIDEDKLNNHVENLEWATNRENVNHSKNKRSTSRYPGVSWCKPREIWRSHALINGKLKYIGSFKIEVDAHKAYVDFLKENNLS